MKIILSEIDHIFDCAGGRCCSIVIENQKLFYSVIRDIFNQVQGEEGISVLSEDNKVLPMAKHIELLTRFVPFDMNQKSFITKMTTRMQNIAVDESHYLETKEMIGKWEQYLMKLSLDLVGAFEFSKISIETLIKAAGIRVDDDYDNLGEQLLDYFELVQEYDGKKLFILVNLRSYLSDAEMNLFLQNIIERDIQILILESSEHPILECECRHIVDADFCILC